MTDPTPGQTIGPFFGYALPYAGGPELVPAGRAGAIRLHGHVLDGAGEPVPDALVELWQNDAAGNVPREAGSLHRDGWTFTGWGRAATDAAGRYTFTTLRPGAPFVVLTVFARGLLDRLFTRAYLEGVDDALLTSLPPARRATLLAHAEPDGYRFDIVLQGDAETVFLEYPPPTPVSSLFWPGDERAGDTFTEATFLRTMVRVETAWLQALAESGVAPPDAAVDLTDDAGDDDVDSVAVAAAAGGNPVIPLVTLLRERLRARGETAASTWVHRGLTSQDVVDTALVAMARDAVRSVRDDLRQLVPALTTLADRHRATAMVGRTLSQHAVPIRFGSKAAGWLQGVLDAADDLDRLRFPGQLGGAAGTLSGTVALTGGDVARALALGGLLDLDPAPPWHTNRAPVTRIADALTTVTAACGRIATDVVTLGRPEIGELREAAGGGSSTMPQKANPVLAVLVRRAALAAPGLSAQLHLAAATTGDERPSGAWHLEWQPLQLLARHTRAAVSQTLELAQGLQVDRDRMAANLAASAGVHAERDTLTGIAGTTVTDWTGADDALVDAALTRAQRWLSAPA